jgi:hypothetical protein
MNFKNFIIVLIVLAAFIFTGAVLYLFFLFQVEPKTLIVAFFGFVATELGALAAIQATKIKNPPEKVVKRDL